MKIFLKKFDIVLINETHFNERIKCPDGFIFEGRSEKIESKTPRGGVAVFKNKQCSINIEIICNSMRDCIVFEVKNSSMVIAAQYIPPSNSIYFDGIYMENLKLLYDKFKIKNLLLLGDLNARVGDVSYSDPAIKHCKNPDNIVNSNGRQLLKWMEQREDMILLNGLRYKDRHFDSNYTFYRGQSKSQNDLAFSNDVSSILSFSIHQKLIQSDHCPIIINCQMRLSTPMEFVHDCAYHTFSNDQYDVNRRLKKPIRFDRIDIPKALEKLSMDFELGVENNNVSTINLTNHIYKCCSESYTEKERNHIDLSGNLLNCNSTHFKAIADANLFTYRIMLDQNDPTSITYLNNWIKFENLARKATNNEMNVKVNKSWRDKKYDPKKLWKAIDWKGNAEIKVEKPAHESDTMKYFTAIFQSEKTKEHPIVSDIVNEVHSYSKYIPSLDDPFSMDELNVSLMQMGTGVSLDGIPPSISKILPRNIKENMLDLMNRVFHGPYPEEWSKQILHSIKKDGHTPGNPKLRGIAIAPFLCRTYDIMIDVRFCSWYTPNKEQAAGKKEQGCPLQIFMLLLMIDYSREKGKDLFVGFLDYEKAFDFANRAGILSDMIKKGCGSNFTTAIANMFQTSTYYPKSNKNYLSDGITTDFGVTQGRRSSGSLFSFYVSDMPEALNDIQYDDFMDPLSLAQLADDSAIYAEKIFNLIMKFKRIFGYSNEKRQIANIPKTVYCNFSANPRISSLEIDDDLTLKSVDPIKGYKYIGIFVFPTNEITDIIQRNVNKRMVNFAKYHAWLSVNELTPIDVKLNVLDSCVLGAVLHGSECWGDITCVKLKLLEKELTALHSVLKVKKGTTVDLIYHELSWCSIIAKIHDRQFNFYQKIVRLTSDVAIVKLMIEKLAGSEMLKYYENLHGDNGDREREERKHRILASTNSMCKYYCDLELHNRCELYTSMLSDYFRVIISRWRLSNHRLNIETGRYTKPKTPRQDRVCNVCNILEDERHVIYKCPRYREIRIKYEHLIANDNIKQFLNPKYGTIKDTACFLYDIEARRRELKL